MSAPTSSTPLHREALGPVDLVKEVDFSLGPNTVKPSAREFVHGNDVEALEPRVMQVLVALARQAGQVVSRDQLIEQCWAGRVVGEDAIQRCITRIRKLADSYGGFELHTIARVGYRLTVAESPPPPQLRSEIARPRNRKRLAIVIGVIAAALAVTFGFVNRRASQQEEARLEQTLTTIEDLVRKDDLGAAFTAAYPLARVQSVRSEKRFAALWSRIVLPMRPLISEAGATVYFKPYASDGEWIKAGISPIKEWIDAPMTTLRVRVEKPGFRTGLFTIAVPGPSVEIEKPINMGQPQQSIPLPLIADGSLPDDMVLVPRTDVPIYLLGWAPDLFGGQRYDIPAFAIGKYEVTNREFKEFVAAGGYSEPRYWSDLKFTEQGRPLTWQEARAKFVDSSGRPGPSGWQLSTYPRDEADFPVSGISWYEAVAYARYRGLELPTIHHWLRAGFSPLSAIFYTTPAIAKASQFEQKGPAAAHSEMGLGPWGTYHMLGNAREWVANFSGNDAIALGSSWLNFPVDCITPYGSDPMRRAPENGLRLMKKLSDSPIDAQLQQPIKLTRDTDVFKRDPVSDEAFKAMRFQFSKAPKPVEVTKQEIERTELYIVEEVTLKFARDPPMILHLARPTAKQSRPLQAIIFGPGGNCCFMKRDNRDNVENLREADFVPISGRLLVMPVWAGAYERFEPYPLDVTQQLDRGRRNALAWQHDLSASIDYLESLEDVDAQKVGYVGYSMGASVISITLAIENRVKAAVFVSSGLILTYKLHPMSDMMNYAPRITIPVLMMNGRYDHAFSYEKSQLPLFNLLGTPAKDKRQIIYDTGHFAFGSRAVAAEATNWFDQYLGPVR